MDEAVSLRFELADGHGIPAIGLGTWKSPANEVYEAVREAITAGYRHIDGAWIYGNEEQVGRAVNDAIASGEVTRDELFLTSKLWNSFHDPDDVEKGLRESLEAWSVDYLDLYLMHWPIAFKSGVDFPSKDDDFIPLSELPFERTYESMLKLRERGWVRSVGVANFSASKLDRLTKAVGLAPTVNQVELHPHKPQNDLVAYCHDRRIHMTAYSPLASGDRPDMLRQKNEPPLLQSRSVLEAAETEGLTPAQVLIAWAIDRNTSVIPKSTNPNRIRENIAHLPHSLSIDARKLLDGIETDFRYVDPEVLFRPGITHEGDDFWA